jgi:thiamine-monophosphate kinase
MTDIAAIGGEFALIRRITRGLGGGPDAGVLLGVGDDCAVLPHRDGEVLLVTTDMLVEEDHFSLRWASPRQVGIKAAEANLSDIAAMGGRPRWAFLSLALTPATSAETVEGIYRGLGASFGRHGVALAGGDTTHGVVLVICVTLLGTAAEDQVRRRSDARVGDLIGVTGDLGKSWAGLELCRAERQAEGDVRPFLEPRCRLDAAPLLARWANALIDVSDGLASEVRHICQRSGTGAEVIRERIPLSDATRAAGRLLGKDPYVWALSGGEDFELVFTARPAAFDRLRVEGLDVTEVGRVLPAGEGLWLVQEGRREPLPGGYDHFADPQQQPDES